MKATNPDVPPTIPRQPSSQLIGHEGPASCVVFTDDGKYCLTGGYDRTVRLWNPFRYDPIIQDAAKIKNGADSTIISSPTTSSFPPRAMPIQTYTSGYTHTIQSILSTEGRTSSTPILVAASNKTLIISDMMTQQVKRRFQSHHTSVINQVAAAAHAEAYLTASYDGTVAIWDGRSSDYKPIQVLKEAKDSVTDVHVIQKNDSTNSKHFDSTAIIRTASVDGCVRQYDLRKGVLHVDDCGSPITSIAATKDGECLAASCLDGTIRLMQVDSGELLNTYSGHQAGTYGLDVRILASDSTLISASEDGVCILSDLVQAHCVQRLQTNLMSNQMNEQKPQHQIQPTCSIATHPKLSSVVVTASYNERTVVWSHDSNLFYTD